MKHPNPTKLREVAAKFREIYVNEKETKLDFDMSYVKPTPCGTVACHGGWALVAIEGLEDSRRRPYAAGVQQLEQYLTTNPNWRFPLWAYENPDLWGNTYGIGMFFADGYKAFDSECFNCTLLTIADHYDAVAARIEELT